MRVSVESDGYGGVTEHLGDYLHVDSLAQEERGTRMAEIVEAQILPNAGARLDTFKGAVTQIGALLIGLRTYESFAGAWPKREGEFADKFNAMPKFVVSRTL